MQVAPIPENESARLQALRQYNILDTEAEAVYDEFISLASFICQTPLSMISLIDSNRQWFKAKVGCDVSETPRDFALCAYTILQKEVLLIPDASQDERFFDNPLVTGSPFIRMYAGAPLFTPEGQAIGTLCVIDNQSRELSTEQINALQKLANQVVSQLELRRITTKLQQLLVSKNKLFHTLSHDLRSPFNGIHGFSQVLAEGAQYLSRDDMQKYSQMVMQASEHFMQLITNLLHSAQFELGTLDFLPIPLRIDQVMKIVLGLMDSNAKGKNIELIYQNSPELEVIGDATMIHSIFQNIISNALKFTPENGRVTLETREQGNTAQISVTDTGIGMSREKLDSLFTNTHGRSTPGTSGEKGTGLGLLLSKDLVEKHGGRLWAESKEGHGTTIHVVLPCSSAGVSVLLA